MSFIRQALEECATCDKTKMVTSGDPAKNGIDDKSSFTYSEDNKGIKDTIMMNGPLSDACTKALNMAFKKIPLDNVENEPTLDESVTNIEMEKSNDAKDPILRQNKREGFVVGSESNQQEDEVAEVYLLREFDNNSKELNFLANNFDFVKPEELPHNIVCNTTVFTVGKLLEPENLFFFTDKKPSSPIDNVILVVSDALGRTAQTTTTKKIVDVKLKDDFFGDIDQERDFKAVVENYITPAGYTVCLGVESYVAHLKKLRKTLDGK